MLGSERVWCGPFTTLEGTLLPLSLHTFWRGQANLWTPRLLDRKPTRRVAARCEEVLKEARGNVWRDLRARMGRGRSWKKAEHHTTHGRGSGG